MTAPLVAWPSGLGKGLQSPVRGFDSRRHLVTLGQMTAGHTITIEPSSQHVEVHVAGERIASSDNALVLYETGAPDRYYLPRDDVRTDLLRPLNMNTTCPFKGEASYWTLEVNGEVLDGVAWSYETPIRDAEQIAGRLAFYNDRVDLRLDGEPATVS